MSVCVFCVKVQYDVSMLLLVQRNTLLDSVRHGGSRLFTPDVTQSLFKAIKMEAAFYLVNPLTGSYCVWHN